MPDPNRRPWESKLSEAATRIEAELRAAVKTIDNEVVPEVRKHSSNALRTLAAKMQQLAESMDDARRKHEAGAGNTGGPPHPKS